MPKRTRAVSRVTWPFISDDDHEKFERLGNAAIHEIVFALNHSDNDGPEEANQCILTAMNNLAVINEKLAQVEAAMERARQ